MKETNRRIEYIDFLKFIGILCVILAHVNPPEGLDMIRNFDVPLLVIVSSILAEKSYTRFISNDGTWWKYCINRFQRLVVPTWIFLLFYFTLVFIKYKSFFEFDYYLASFGLTRFGIAYVWIILIYLYSALLVPLFNKIGFSFKTIACVLVIYMVYEALFHFGIGENNKFLNTTVYYIIPYGMLTFIGFNFSKIKDRNKIIITVLSFAIFGVMALRYRTNMGAFQSVGIFKFPPRLYFLSYGIACTLALLIVGEKFSLKLYKNKLIVFISKHSLWIYLWHIFWLEFVYSSIKGPDIWYVKYLFVMICSVLTTWGMNKLIDLVEAKTGKSSALKYFRG